MANAWNHIVLSVSPTPSSLTGFTLPVPSGALSQLPSCIRLLESQCVCAPPVLFALIHLMCCRLLPGSDMTSSSNCNANSMKHRSLQNILSIFDLFKFNLFWHNRRLPFVSAQTHQLNCISPFIHLDQKKTISVATGFNGLHSNSGTTVPPTVWWQDCSF